MNYLLTTAFESMIEELGENEAYTEIIDTIENLEEYNCEQQIKIWKRFLGTKLPAKRILEQINSGWFINDRDLLNWVNDGRPEGSSKSLIEFLSMSDAAFKRMIRNQFKDAEVNAIGIPVLTYEDSWIEYGETQYQTCYIGLTPDGVFSLHLNHLTGWDELREKFKAKMTYSSNLTIDDTFNAIYSEQ